MRCAISARAWRARGLRPRGALRRAASHRLGLAVLMLVFQATLAAHAQPSRPADAAPDVSWIDRAALEKGTILVEAVRVDRPLTVGVRVAALVAARPEAIWKVLTACEIAPEYVPNVQSCRSLEKLDGGELFVQVVKPAFFIPSFEHVFRLDYDEFEHIGVHRVSGPIEHMDGSWWLISEPATRRVLLVYELAVDPGFPVPRFFVRATLKRDLPRIVTAVRERAERADAPE